MDTMVSMSGEIIWLPVTLAVYAGAFQLARWSNRHPALNPTLLTIAGVSGALLMTGVAYPRYFESVSILNFLLGTAVVALAIPLHRNLGRLKGHVAEFLFALIAGSLASILIGLTIAILAGASASTVLSIAPKSATAAVSIEIARLIGGIPGVTALLTILTGIVGAILGPLVLDACNVRTPEARGFALGVASHGIATARAFSEGEVAGSFAGLGMTLNAVLTALLVPPVMSALHLT